MSLQIDNITKLYGQQKALDGVSFKAKKGEIIGLLGPNGAGKSTMMKIITCFIPQTDGAASVCGFDVREQSEEVRRNIGYLPENNPLYLDMYVCEYLEYVAGVYQLGKNTAGRVQKMIEITGLGPEQHKKIGALSKGYRQRVGLAQAMIHNPKVLILDEPTSGLDPNQLTGIRELIRDLGKEKTVMLSTHIMQEVKAICDRVIIIHKGKIVADSPASELQKSGNNHQIVTVEFDVDIDKNAFFSIVGVESIEKMSGNKWRLISKSAEDIRPAVFRFAVEKGLSVLTLNREEQNLEDVFRQLTT